MKYRIAVVDDDVQLNKLLCEYLNGRGYISKGYFSIKQTHDSLLAEYDVVLLDIQLPDGNGLELLAELRVKYPSLKCIIFTGYDSLPSRLRSFSNGAEDYLKKPIFPSELEARIKRLFRSQTVGKRHVICEPYKYSKNELDILELLLEAHGEIVPLQTISQQFHESKAAVYTTISRLKAKCGKNYRIRSSYGRGWYAEVL